MDIGVTIITCPYFSPNDPGIPVKCSLNDNICRFKVEKKSENIVSFCSSPYSNSENKWVVHKKNFKPVFYETQ